MRLAQLTLVAFTALTLAAPMNNEDTPMTTAAEDQLEVETFKDLIYCRREVRRSSPERYQGSPGHPGRLEQQPRNQDPPLPRAIPGV